MKSCNKCLLEKPLSEFHKQTSAKDGHQYRCKKCAIEMAVARQRSNPERHRAEARKYARNNKVRRLDTNLRHSYGITLVERDALELKQAGVCLICKQTSDKKLQVDHCHASLKVRGLLCWRCNRGLGMFKDSPAALRAAAAYVESV